MLTGSPLSRTPSMSPVTILLQQAQMSPTLQVLTDYKIDVPNLIPNILVDNNVCVCVFVCARQSDLLRSSMLSQQVHELLLLSAQVIPHPSLFPFSFHAYRREQAGFYCNLEQEDTQLFST